MRPPVAAAVAAAPADGPVVLDGGLATTLEAGGHDLSGHLWSARLVLDEPEAVVAAHGAFFAAGARVATTVSYQASFEGLARAGLDRAGAVRVLERTVALARTARDEAEARAGDGLARWVAASVGPRAAALADGSEYRGDDGSTVAQLRAWHRPRLEVLAAAGPDVLALETIPRLGEVEALLGLVEGIGLPCWLSVTCDGDRTRAGEPVAEAMAMAADVDEVVAVGVNCCAPSDVVPAMAMARAAGLPGVAYPNVGQDWDAAAHRWSGPVTFVPGAAGDWVAAGAALVGGCCGVGPRDIAAMRAEVDRG